MGNLLRTNTAQPALGNRYQVLGLVVAKYLDGAWGEGFVAEDVAAVFGSRGNSAKETWQDASAYQRVLESLAETGELHDGAGTNKGRFWVTPKAIATLVEYELNERRHLDGVKLQRILIGLTIVLAVGTLVSAVAAMYSALSG